MIKRTGRPARWLVVALAVVALMLLASQSVLPQEAPTKYPLGDIPLDTATYFQHMKGLWSVELAETLPTSYDARGEGIVTPAKDQGQCGSCWAFASVGAMESHMLKAFSFGPEDLSEQQQVSCNTAMLGCRGGNQWAIRYWEAKGPLQEACFPYTASDSTPCTEDQCLQLGFRVVGWHTVPANSSDFKSSLYDDGPSYWRFDVYDDFYSHWNYAAPGTVYVNSTSSGFEGGHAVLLIGWDDAKGAYLCKNSWGQSDGPNGDGTFWIAYSGHGHDLGFGMANFGLTGGSCDGDRTCEEGEDCHTCPSDCISGSGGGTCSACFKGTCDGVCHPVKEDETCADCATGYCCGDGVCSGEESVGDCRLDCGCSSDPECDDGNTCTTDRCDGGGCSNTWPACGIEDGCCGPDCTAGNDDDCTSACVPASDCNCNGKCGKKESHESCPFDCP